MTLHARGELVQTARRMSELGLTPGMSGNVSARIPHGLLVTPSGMPYGELARTLVTGVSTALAAPSSRSWTLATYSHAATDA